ncbi:hypothetical protein BC834DRAFT_866830 [Gloeopeniophorella convolvens]|nr:hypothetical protein BC834DRAFT_866830 [Gloeopeniophorella convolvens]
MSVYPRVTYQTSGRTFDRLFKEASLEETKNVVRKKLNLSPGAEIELSQLRDGKRIDLEDEDDFEAFRALARSSLHATVEVTVPDTQDAPNPTGEEPRKRKQPPPPSPSKANKTLAAPRGTATHAIGSSTDAVDGSRPRKKQKTAATSDDTDPPPSHEAVILAVDTPAPIPAKVRLQKSREQQAAPPVEVPAKVQVPPKTVPAVAGAAPQDVDEDAPTVAPQKRRRKKNADADPQANESPPGTAEHVSADGVATPNPQKKLKRKKNQATISEITTEGQRRKPVKPTAIASPPTTVHHPDPKLRRTAERDSGPLGNGGSPAAGGTDVVGATEAAAPDFVKSRKGKKSKKPAQSTSPGEGGDDDINKTIAAFLNRRSQVDLQRPSNSVDPGGPVPSTDSNDPGSTSTSKRKRKHDESKTGTTSVPREREDQSHPIAQIALTGEANPIPPTTNAVDMAGRAKRGKSKPSTSLIPQGAVEPTSPSAAAVSDGEPIVDAPESASGRYFTSVQLLESESEFRLGFTEQDLCPVCFANPTHPLADCPVVQEGPSSIDKCIAEMEVNPGLEVGPDVIFELRTLAAKARSTPPDMRNASPVVHNTRMPVTVSAVAAASAGGSSAGMKLTVPKGLAISEVAVEGRGEGSSDESSSDDEDEENAAGPSAKATASVPSLPVPTHVIEDQLAAIIRGPEQRGPRKSILDEIPSSSDSESESDPEDLMLDEEEDLSQQPSRKMKGLSKVRLPSAEPEPASEDEDERISPPVLMDAPQVLQHHEESPAVSEVVDGALPRHTPEPSSPIPDQRPVGNVQDKIDPGSAAASTSNVPEKPTSAKAHRQATPESDATAINPEPTTPPVVDQGEQLTGRVLVPASSPIMNRTLKLGKEDQENDEDDDIEPADDEQALDHSDADPIEPEPTLPAPVQPGSLSGSPVISSEPRGRTLPARHAVTGTPSTPEQPVAPARRSGRLASRQSLADATEATPVPAKKVVRKSSLAVEGSMPSEKVDSGTKAKPAQERNPKKAVSKPSSKSTRHSTMRLAGSKDEASLVPVREEDLSQTTAPSQVEWTVLPASEPTHLDTSSGVDELRASSLDAINPSQGDNELPPSSEDEAITPKPGRKRAPPASQGNARNTQPLFFPGSSQAPRYHAPASPSATESESENETPLLAKRTPARPTPAVPFRRLSHIASQDVLFSNSKVVKHVYKNEPKRKVKSMLADTDKDEDDEDTSSDPSDDSAPKSHIPEDRRAGAKTRKKGKGLSSLG